MSGLRFYSRPVVKGALTRSPTTGKLQLFSNNFMIIIITALIILRRVSLLLSSKRIIYGKIVNYFSNHWCYSHRS